jgi:hypothetical protein
MASPTRGRSSARSSKAKRRRKTPDNRPRKQAGKKRGRKKGSGGNPTGKGHRSSTTWQEGQSGNEAGRPKKGDALADIAIAKMDIKDAFTPEGKKLARKDALVEMLYSKAIQQRDMVAFKELREMLSHGGAPVDEPTTTAAAVYAGVLAFLRKLADKHPELKQELIDGFAESSARPE